MVNYVNRIILVFFLILSAITSINAQDNAIRLNGVVVDTTEETIPFVTIGIVGKSIGTASTEDGEFSLLISKDEMQDTLYVSSLGYDTYKVKVENFILNKQHKVLLKENIVSLSTVTLLHPKDYVINALKKLKENTLSKWHLKEILFRRAATEEGKSKFFVENFIKFKDRGPARWIGRVQVTESRKSADYRFWKRTQWRHEIHNMTDVNPLRPNDSQHAVKLQKFNWKKLGDSSYEGEDVLILEGYHPKKKWQKTTLYVGIDSYKVYRIERGKTLYIYKKHKSGKLHLSYYKTEWNFPKHMIPEDLVGSPAETLHYKSEAFILNVETEKKKTKIRDYGINVDMGSLDLEYHPDFWAGLNMPPDTKFFKRIKSELEDQFGIPLEKQYQLINK